MAQFSGSGRENQGRVPGIRIPERTGEALRELTIAVSLLNDAAVSVFGGDCTFLTENGQFILRLLL